ncbi:MAG: hypothetical protein Q9190_005572 [Brigantiaea leucoxantha]
MVAGIARPRSNTSDSTVSSRRPKSRASNANVHSKPLPKYSYESSETAHNIAVHTNSNRTLQYSPEEMITRSEYQLTNPDQPYPIDPSLQRPQHARALSMDHNMNGNSGLHRPPLNQYQSYDGKENQSFEINHDETAQDDASTLDGKKKKGSASSIANDLELRRLFRENVGRSLKDVAAQVLANERGPRSEKTKQIFAMLWYIFETGHAITG